MNPFAYRINHAHKQSHPSFSPEGFNLIYYNFLKMIRPKTTIALAQSASTRGDTEANLRKHMEFTALAAEKGAQLIVFPELSLTGYEPDIAAELAFPEDDKRLIPLKELAVRQQIIILAGAPFRSEKGLHIAAFIFYPDRPTAVYTKHYLHPGEENFFTPGSLNPVISLGEEKIAVAVCADMANPLHAQEAAGAGCTIYLGSAFITPGGYEADARILKNYAHNHCMTVMMANYSGRSGGFDSAGRSAVWSETGDLAGELAGDGEGVLLATKENNHWKCEGISMPLPKAVK